MTWNISNSPEINVYRLGMTNVQNSVRFRWESRSHLTAGFLEMFSEQSVSVGRYDVPFGFVILTGFVKVHSGLHQFAYRLGRVFLLVRLTGFLFYNQMEIGARYLDRRFLLLAKQSILFSPFFGALSLSAFLPFDCFAAFGTGARSASVRGPNKSSSCTSTSFFMALPSAHFNALRTSCSRGPALKRYLQSSQCPVTIIIFSLMKM